MALSSAAPAGSASSGAQTGRPAADEAIAEIRSIFSEFGTSDYIGEAVTQEAHALQCADLARQAGAEAAVIAGALLHGESGSCRVAEIWPMAAASLWREFVAPKNTTWEDDCRARGYVSGWRVGRHSATQGGWPGRCCERAADIGHMLGLREGTTDLMDDCGVVNHEGIGRVFCDGLGFPETVGLVVEGHVQAKRYLCWKNPAYASKLSDASKTTLRHQGGAMEDAEAAAFERSPMFDTILKMRTWDEAAKVVGKRVPTLDDWEPLLHGLLKSSK